MRIIFFGTTSFSASLLKSLASLPEHTILAVVTRPDRPQGRDLKLKASPVKEFVLENLPEALLFQPEKASTDSFCEELQGLNPDLFLVVAYGEILKQNILSIPLKACVNIHTSLLPRLRGAAPIQRCLMEGDSLSGVTFMEMALKMDAGDILKQESVLVSPSMNALELEQSLLDAAKDALPEFLLHFDSYYQNKKRQDESLVTIASKINPVDCVIDWTKSVHEIHNQVRALSPSPGVFLQLQFGEKSKRLKILSSFVIVERVEEVGKLHVDQNTIKISCKNGFLGLLVVQLEGKKAMKAEEFLRGVSKHFSLNS